MPESLDAYIVNVVRLVKNDDWIIADVFGNLASYPLIQHVLTINGQWERKRGDLVTINNDICTLNCSSSKEVGTEAFQVMRGWKEVKDEERDRRNALPCFDPYSLRSSIE